jgi:very-short-patch-repair endonuclease
MNIKCKHCDKTFNILIKEFKRQTKKGRSYFFCCLSCAAKFKNLQAGIYPITKTCKYCNKKFLSSTKKRSPIFCSRGCASAGSVTDYRRNKAIETGNKYKYKLDYSMANMAKVLRKREERKYKLLKNYLLSIKEKHIFEFVIGQYIFDLCLMDRKMLIEFDSPYHKNPKQQEKDYDKEKCARDNGWSIFRISTEYDMTIPVEGLEPLLNRKIYV